MSMEKIEYQSDTRICNPRRTCFYLFSLPSYSSLRFEHIAAYSSCKVVAKVRSIRLGELQTRTVEYRCSVPSPACEFPGRIATSTIRCFLSEDRESKNLSDEILQKDQSPIPFSDERIRLIGNRAPVFTPICARADPSPHQRGNFHIPFWRTYPNHIDDGGSRKFGSRSKARKLDAPKGESYSPIS